MGAGTSTRDTSGRGSLGDVSPYDDAQAGLLDDTAEAVGDMKSAAAKYFAEETMSEKSFQGWQTPVPGQCSEQPLRSSFEVSSHMECEVACEKLQGCRVANVETIERQPELREDLPRKDILHEGKTSLPIFPKSKKVDGTVAAAASETGDDTANNEKTSIHMCHLHDKCTPKPLSIVLEKQWVKVGTNNGHMRCKKQDNALKRPTKTKFAMGVSECKAQCEADQGCNVIEYDNETKTCQFFASVSKCKPVGDSKKVGRGITHAFTGQEYQYKEVHNLNWVPHGMSCSAGGQKLFAVKDYLMKPTIPVYTPPELVKEEPGESGSLAELKQVYKKILVQRADKEEDGLHKEENETHKEKLTASPDENKIMEIQPALPKKALHACKMNRDPSLKGPLVPSLDHQTVHHVGDTWLGTSARCKFIQLNQFPTPADRATMAAERAIARSAAKLQQLSASNSAAHHLTEATKAASAGDFSTMAGKLVAGAGSAGSAIASVKRELSKDSGVKLDESVPGALGTGTPTVSNGKANSATTDVGQVATMVPTVESTAVGALPGEVSCPMYEQCTTFTHFRIHTHNWQHVGHAKCTQDPLKMNVYDTQRLDNTLEKTFYKKHKKLMEQFNNDVHQVLATLQDQDDAHEELVRAGKATTRPPSVTNQEKCLLYNDLLDAEASKGTNDNAGASALEGTSATAKKGPPPALLDTQKMYLHNCLKACECNPDCTAIQITRTPKITPKTAAHNPNIASPAATDCGAMDDGMTYSQCKLFKTCSRLPDPPSDSSAQTVVYRDPPPAFHSQHICDGTTSDLTLATITSAENCRAECALDPQCQAYWLAGAECHLRRAPLPSARPASCKGNITAYARISPDFSEHANRCGDGPFITLRGPDGAYVITHDDVNACAKLCTQTHKCRAFEHITFSNTGVKPLCTLKKSTRSAMCPQWVSSNEEAHPRFFTRSDIDVPGIAQDDQAVDVGALNAHAHAAHAHERERLLALGPVLLIPVLQQLFKSVSSLWDFNPLHYHTGSHWSEREGVTVSDTPELPIGSELAQDPDALAINAARTKVHAQEAAEAAKAAGSEAREAVDIERRVFKQNVRLLDEYAHFRRSVRAGCPADGVWPLTPPNMVAASLCPPGSLSHMQRRVCDASGYWSPPTSCSGMSTVPPQVLHVHEGHGFLDVSAHGANAAVKSVAPVVM
eukprot:GEMP01003741.1.p1 GENE.GEMP01003741.1~~GEMP01003741.1.p1  ORF type:complete len:1187 (+),score=303.66 GEMP01003741.1:354-3914(+)